MSSFLRPVALLAACALLAASSLQDSKAPDACRAAERFLEESIRNLEGLTEDKLETYTGREREVGAGFEVELRALIESDIRGWTKKGLESLRAELRALRKACATAGVTARDLEVAAWRSQSRSTTFLWNTHMDVTRACISVLQAESSMSYGTRSDRWRQLERADGDEAEEARQNFRADEQELRGGILDDFDTEYQRLRRLRRVLVEHLWKLELAASEAGDANWRTTLSVQRFELFDLATGYAVVPTLRLDVVHGLSVEDCARYAWTPDDPGGRKVSMKDLYEPDVQKLVASLVEVPLPDVVGLRVVELVEGHYLERTQPLQHERPFYVELEFLREPREELFEVQLASSLEGKAIVVHRVKPRLYRSAVLFLEAAAELE